MNKDLMVQMGAAQKEAFKYIAFSGGGAKGAIYSGVHETLIQSGVLAGVQEVAGSSAGAITAAIVASGISREDFRNLSQNTNFKDLLGSGTIIPGTDVTVNAGGEPMEELVRNAINKNITDYLKDADVLEICNTRIAEVGRELTALQDNNDQAALDRSEILQKQQAELQSITDDGGVKLAEINKRVQETGKVTFGDLDLLHNLNPSKFKGLVITATNNKTGELMLFNAKDTPDVEIARAAHASSSIPYVFKPVAIDGVEYADGACYDNIPLKYFNGNDPRNDVQDITDSPDKVRDAKKQGRALALAFSSANEMDTNLNAAVYSGKPNITGTSFMSKVVTVVIKAAQKLGLAHSLKDYDKKDEATYQEVRNNSLNIIALDTKDVGILSFDAAKDKASYLHVKGALQTARHFANHEVGNHHDANLATKEFMLQVYEDSHTKKSTISKWKDKIFGAEEAQNLESLLDCCKVDVWKGKNAQEMLANFVENAVTNRNGKAVSNTHAMDKLIETLNNPKTPDSIKMQFAQLTNIEVVSRVVDTKFQANDFDALLAKKNVQKLHTINDANKSKNKVKNILKAGKEASMADKIQQEVAKAPSPKGR